MHLQFFDGSVGMMTPQYEDARGLPEGGERMELKEMVRGLADLIWEREQRIPQVETAILGYVQDVVLAEIEYRRRMRDLDRRLTELESTSEAGVSILSP